VEAPHRIPDALQRAHATRRMAVVARRLQAERQDLLVHRTADASSMPNALPRERVHQRFDLPCYGIPVNGASSTEASFARGTPRTRGGWEQRVEFSRQLRLPPYRAKKADRPHMAAGRHQDRSGLSGLRLPATRRSRLARAGR
jgi:hypothetical protein